MPWDQRQRERMAALLEAQPVQSVCAKRCVLISERTRDAIVEDLRNVQVHKYAPAEFGWVRVEENTIKRPDFVGEPRGFWARLRWVIFGAA